MCGIVGAVADRAVTAVLLEGLRRLEYRGCDSAGMATLGAAGFERLRVVGSGACGSSGRAPAKRRPALCQLSLTR